MESQQVQPVPADAAERERQRTFHKNKWVFSASGVGRDICYQLIATFLLTYIQFGVSLTLAQFTALSLIIGVGGRIWDAINDPLMGAIIEGSHFRAGKFRPWILMGALACGLVIVLMFGIQSIPGWRFVVFISILYLLWESTFTMNDIGYWSMLPSLSSEKDERNAATTLTVLFAGIGAIIAQGVIPMVTVGDVRAGYRMVGLAVGVIFALSGLVVFFGVKETPRPKKELSEKISLSKMWRTIRKNDQILWITLSMLFYNIASMMLIALAANLLYLEIGYNGTWYFYVVVAYGVTNVLVNALYPALVNRMGREKLQKRSITAACIGYVLVGAMGWTGALPFNVWLLCAFSILISGGQALFYMSSIVNMTNCVEYNDYKFGERSEAVVSTLRPFMAKFAAAMHTLIITLVLTISGTFLLSQSISTLETQRDFFSKIPNAAAQADYIEAVQSYLGKYDGLDIGTPEYDAVAARIGGEIDANAAMRTFQIDPQYLPALGDAMLQSTDEVGGAVYLGRLREIDPAQLRTGDGLTYTLAVGDLENGQESAANLHFRDKGTLSMRIWIRLAVTLLPIVLLLLALYVQRKKFIINEEYYDRMIAEIKRRKEAVE